MSRIVPKADKLQIVPIYKSTTEVVYLFDVPESKNVPHMAGDKRYYKRLNFQSIPIEHIDVARLFRRDEDLQRLHALRLMGDPVDWVKNRLFRVSKGQPLEASSGLGKITVRTAQRFDKASER